jgi:hypothetical protein
MKQTPHGYRNNPTWEAFELWADTHGIPDEQEDWEPWWECFLAGFEIGLAEAE